MRSSSYLTIRDHRGFSLVELMIALVIFSFGVLAVGAMQITSMHGNSKSRMVSEAANAATDFMENLLAREYQHALLIDDDDGKDETDADTNAYDATKDGTEEDGDGNGTDDNGGNFGLDDTVNPDGHSFSVDGVYEIFWNVAVDYPRDGVKTLKVIATWDEKGVSKILTLTNIKAEE